MLPSLRHYRPLLRRHQTVPVQESNLLAPALTIKRQKKNPTL